MLEWIFSSSLLILIVILLRLLFRRRLTSSVQYAVWLVVLLRLLVPFQLFTVPVGVADYTPAPPAALEEKTIYVLPMDSMPAASVQAEVDSATGEVTMTDPNSMGYLRISEDGERVIRYFDRVSISDLLLLGWVAGAVLVAAGLLFFNLRFYRRLRRVRQPWTDAASKLPVYLAEGLPSPCLFGLLRPAIYITPAAAARADSAAHILTHEETHYRHGDHIWSLLRCTALALHWYNPLVWAAAVLSKQDGEMACDEGALRRLGEQERIAYGQTLLSLISEKPRPTDLLSCATTMTSGKRGLRERIARIAKGPKMLLVTLAAAVVLVAAAAVFVFSQGSADPADGETDAQELVTLAVNIEQGDSVLEVPQLHDTGSADAEAINDAMTTIAEEYQPIAEGEGDVRCQVYTYPCSGESSVTMVLLANTYPSYGTDGALYTFCYDFTQRREISIEEALASSGWTEDMISLSLTDYIYDHLTEFGYPEDASAFTSGMDLVGFRQRGDGGYDFFLQYHKEEDIYSGAWDYLLTFTDGVIIKGVAIPTEETIDIGCRLTGLAPYSTEGRSVVMTADAVMAGLQAEDMRDTTYFYGTSTSTAEELSSAIRGASSHVVTDTGTMERFTTGNYTLWNIWVYLEDEFTSEHRQLRLSAGAAEDLVEVVYSDSPYVDTVIVEDAPLYWLIRNCYSSDGEIDEEALAPLRPLIEAEAEETLQYYQENAPEAGYHGYEITSFYLTDTFDDITPGAQVEIYSFSYALTMTDPTKAFWVGGNYLDSKLRAAGCDNYTYLAVERQDGAITRTAFLFYDLYFGPSEEEGREQAKDTIAAALTG